MRWLLMLVVLSSALTVLPFARGQDAENTPPQRRYRFWSGHVSNIAGDSISVSRTLPGREPETRKFVLTSTTKIDGDLQRSSRVTVGYVEIDQSLVAHRIVVRKRRHR